MPNTLFSAVYWYDEFFYPRNLWITLWVNVGIVILKPHTPSFSTLCTKNVHKHFIYIFQQVTYMNG